MARNATFTGITITGCALNSAVTVIIIKSRTQFETLWAGTATNGAFTLTNIAVPDNFTPGIYQVQLSCGTKTASTSVTITRAGTPPIKPGPYGPTATLTVVTPNRDGTVTRGQTLTYVAGQECAAGSWVVLYLIKGRTTYAALGTTRAAATGVFTFDSGSMSPIPLDITPGNYVLTAKCQSGAYIDSTLPVR